MFAEGDYSEGNVAEMGTVLYVSEIKSFREHFEALTYVCMYVHKCM